MNKMLEKLYMFLFEKDMKFWSLVQVFNKDYTFEFYFFKIYEKNIYDKNLYIYMKAKKMLEILLTFFMFMILYKFDMSILDENFIFYYSYYLSIMFFMFVSMMLKNLFMGFWKENMQVFEKGKKSLMLLMNFLINVKMLMWILNMNFDDYLQYNMLFVFDSILFLMLYLYNNMNKVKMKGDSAENFMYYPYMIMMMMLLVLKSSEYLKFWVMLYIVEYMMMLHMPCSWAYHGEKLEKEWENDKEMKTMGKLIMKEKKM